ncbi:MAG TPA: hypothetical protein VFY23_13100 [Candidatus Limnocylindrales bacterium]|nr:hypothetical protein [Candidatus Limnocylindrales bacterium]
MSASVPAASAGTRITGPAADRRGLVSRLVAGALHVAVGLGMAASVVGVGVAQAILARGVVVADAGDVALLNALAPVTLLFGLVGGAHVIAGIGIVFGSRQAAAFGIGLGLFDIVAGIVGLVIAAGSTGSSADGVGISMAVLLLGIVTAIAARVADWNTHGPLFEGPAPSDETIEA